MPGDYRELEKENRELRIAKNMLIDRVEAQERALQEQPGEKEPGRKALQHTGSQAQEAAGEEETGLMTAAGRSDRLFRRAEAVLYRIWVSFWMAAICILLSIAVTVMLNAELREHIFWVFGSYFAG